MNELLQKKAEQDYIQEKFQTFFPTIKKYQNLILILKVIKYKNKRILLD